MVTHPQDGSLVKWDVVTGETSVVVAKETMSKVSKTATFISFSPNNTDLVEIHLHFFGLI